MFHIPTACFTCRPSCCSYILWNVDQSDSFDRLFRLSHFQCEHTSHQNPFNMRNDHFLFPLELTVVFHLFSPHPLNLFWSISCLLHTSVPSLTLPFTFTPLFLITPLSFCSLIAVMYRLPGLFSSSSSPNRIVQQGLCRSLWGEWQCRGPAVPQVENPHWKLDVKVSLLAMRLSQRKPLFVQSML